MLNKKFCLHFAVWPYICYFANRLALAKFVKQNWSCPHRTILQIFKLSRVSFPKNVRFQKTQLGKQNVDWKLMDVVGSAAARGTLHTAVGLFFLTYSKKKVHEVNIFISVPCISFCHCTPLSIWNLQGTGLEDVSPYGGFG